MDYQDIRRSSNTDGLDLLVREWLPAGDQKGSVLILHGLAEHSGRYARFAEALVGAGYAAIAYDHRGHGGSLAASGSFGDMGSAGWAGMIADAVQLVRETKNRHPDKPLILFGHSMGSFIAQQAIIECSDSLDGVVLSGSTDLVMVAELVKATGEAPGFDAYNAAFAPNRTAFDWLSRDEAEVDAYVADPMCGWEAPVELSLGILSAADVLGDTAELSKLRRELPICLVAGSADPLNGGLNLLQSLKARYEGLGLEVSTQFYDDGRHEMLNETNRDDVTEALIGWIDSLN